MEESLKRWLFDPTVGRGIVLLVGLLVIYVLVRFARRSLGRYIQDGDTRYRARKLLTFLGYLAAVFFVALVFGDRLGNLTIAFGVAGAGIAFALQEVIASVAGWAAVSLGGFYRPGDRIQLGGIKGDVIDISILRTTLMECGEWVKADLYTGRIVRVANSFVFKEPVFNYSADFPFLWDEITLPIKYGSDYRLARKVIQQVAEEVVGEYARFAQKAWKDVVAKYLIEDARVEPMVTLTANDNWVEFTLRYVVDYQKRRVTKDQLVMRLLEEFDQSQGRIAIASATFQLVGTSRVDVQLTEKARKPGK